MAIGSNGTLRLFWSQNNNKVEESTLEIENVGGSDDLITHASVCADKGT